MPPRPAGQPGVSPQEKRDDLCKQTGYHRQSVAAPAVRLPTRCYLQAIVGKPLGCPGDRWVELSLLHPWDNRTLSAWAFEGEVGDLATLESFVGSDVNLRNVDGMLVLKPLSEQPPVDGQERDWHQEYQCQEGHDAILFSPEPQGQTDANASDEDVNRMLHIATSLARVSEGNNRPALLWLTLP